VVGVDGIVLCLRGRGEDREVGCRSQLRRDGEEIISGIGMRIPMGNVAAI
jgi:hypothetical protein